jgi:L-alanine-DL-glutamate epimerase-like enolase superfamily enzyme
MKITGIEATPLATPLEERLRWGAMTVGVKGGIVVRVTTDAGLEGIGEAGFSAEFFSTVGPIINQQLAPLLVGEDPRDVTALWQRMFDATHMWGRRGIETYAISGVDIALWDLLGKLTNQPVYRLLGASKSRVRAYLAPSLKGIEETVEECRRAVAERSTAVKLRLGPDPAWGVELVSRVRDAVGDRLELMVDANMAFNRRTALTVARELEQLGVSWLEEPILSRSLTQYVEDHSWLGDRLTMPLAGGESLFSRFEYLELLERRTFDVVQPDCTSVGGISEAKRVADMASAYNLTCVPHIASSSGTGIALAAGLHLILACQNAPLIEFDPYGGPGWDGLLMEPLRVREGWVEALEAPGLGVELTPEAFDRFALDGAVRTA